MRINNSMPGMGDVAMTGRSPGDTPLNGQTKTVVPEQRLPLGGPIQFDSGTPATQLNASSQDLAQNNALVTIINLLLKLLNPDQPGGDTIDGPDRGGPGQSDPLSPTQGIKQPHNVKNPNACAGSSDQTPTDPAAFLDNSKYSSPEELKKYDAQVADLPPEQREQAAKELNRPVAAAKLAAEGGPGAEQAKAFIESNPTLKTAIDTAAHGGKPDGKLSQHDFEAFASKMDKAASAASKDVEKYQKDNPDADAQSLALVRSAATLRANEPLAKAGALNKNGKVDKYITGDALKGLQTGNPGLSPLLQQTAKTFSQPGLLNMLDQGGFEGESLSQHNPDGLISTHNIDDWIKKQAPKNGGEFSSTISDAATRNAVADTDISQLNDDVFNNPTKYTGEQKAAVMIKLQDTLAQVDGGSKLRNVDDTTKALQEKIGLLQADPDVKTYLNDAVPKQENAIIQGDPALTKAVGDRHGDIMSGKSLENDMQTARDKAAKDNEGKKPEDQVPVDYSQALGNLDAELQLQGDLHPGEKQPTAAEVLAKRPDLKKEVSDSYQESFAQGKAVQSALKQDKKSDAEDVLGLVDSKKLAYDTVLGDSVTDAAQTGYAEATAHALTTTKKGMDLIKDLKEAGSLPKDADVKHMSGKDLYSKLRDNVETESSKAGLDVGGKLKSAGSGAFSVASLLSLHDSLKNGDKAGAAKSIYDGLKGSGELGKLGYNAVAQTLGKDASAGLGRVAGAVAGRVVGVVAGEAAGFAAASAIGAAAGPVGWIIDAALGLGFGIKAIIDAVNKQHKQANFDHNVDPTLDQFGIPKPK